MWPQIDILNNCWRASLINPTSSFCLKVQSNMCKSTEMWNIFCPTPEKTVCNIQGATVNKHYMESGWIKRADLHRGYHQVVSRQNSPEFHHFFGWQLLKFTSKNHEKDMHIMNKNWGFLYSSLFSLHYQPTKPTNHVFFGAPTYLLFLHSLRVTIVRPSTLGSASPGGRAPERLRVLRQRQHTRASAALPAARFSGGKVGGNASYFQRWLFIENLYRMIENHSESFAGWFEPTFHRPFSAWFGMFKRKICTIYFPGGKRLRVDNQFVPWQLPFYGNILPHPRSGKQQNPLTSNPTVQQWL